uniref:Uncharacterized protein TCIL3000_11_13890 n=1 Tax=Trypanosoma congolense (strain IL3000) TaxID=1068625 RepID=G0V2L1_TRYCI|nr:unnamed protein product [Trypanosoma congolense IL3000]
MAMRCCRLAFGLGEWSSGLLVLNDALTQVVKPRATRGGSAQNVPLRCVVAKRPLCKGERLCVVPESHIMHGENAASAIRFAAAQGRLSDFSILKQCLANTPVEPQLLCTRDSLLISIAFYVLRYCGVKHPLSQWVAAFPPHVPPLGLLLLQQEMDGSRFKPLERRLRLGSLTASIPSPSNDANVQESCIELMLQAVECDGIGNVGRPQTEVVVTKELMTAFYRGERHPLTKRQHEASCAKRRWVPSEMQQQLLRLEESMYSRVLTPLLPYVAPASCIFPGSSPGNVDDDDNNNGDTNLFDQLRWSHFMMRSRALNLSYSQERQLRHWGHKPRVAVVPFLDMMNHSARQHNVTYQYRPGTGVVVVASKSIKPEEELTLDYGDFKQRGCLFHDAASNGNSDVVDGCAAMRLIESRQMHEWDNPTLCESDGLDHVEDAPFGQGPERLSQKGSGEDSDGYKKEAHMEAAWLWRFGFTRSDDERAFVASKMWSKGLRQRIAQLTDVRRRGRPGEFVIGVPEGLQHLREQRERIERERFGGTKVFPPQNT